MDILLAAKLVLGGRRMQQWDVVGVIAVLLALITTVAAPIVKLTQAIAKLTATMEHMEKNVDCLAANNRSAHERIWARANEQTALLNDHETRIRMMEEFDS
jgi:trans-2-enoyl-CoA reductase